MIKQGMFLKIVFYLLLSFFANASDCIDKIQKIITNTITRKAVYFAKKFHDGQSRKFTNEPYILHPLRVAQRINTITNSQDLFLASILHDVVEDTPATLPDIERHFGKSVAKLVDELTTDNKVFYNFKSKADYLAIRLYHISPEALLVKLCDRLDNVSDLTLAPADFVQRYTIETRLILKSIERRKDLSKEHQKIIQEIKIKISKF